MSGIGAAIAGGRWNSQGTEMINTATHHSLCMAEVAVHFSLATMPKDYMMLTIFVPDHTSVTTISPADLPREWRDYPQPASTKTVGDDLVRARKTYLLRVPSAVTLGDYKMLINPSHAEFYDIKIVECVPFPFDRRLFR
ncbi:MAG: RES domain-containing protein [Bacteroidota bacterium]